MNDSSADRWLALGLTGEEAAWRLAREGPNELPSAKPRSPLAIAASVLREPMFLLLGTISGIYFVVGDLREAFALSIAVVVIIIITVVQEERSEHALQALKELSSPRALVLRDGEARRIAAREAVRGDIVLLSEGDRVPADGAVISAHSLETNESLLTGESAPVRKSASADAAEMQRPGGDDLPFVYSGTLVTAGRGVVRILATGPGTELGKIGKILQELKPERTRLQKESARVVRIFALLGMSLCVVVAVVHTLTRGNLLRGIMAGLTLAISMVPEELAVVLTVFLAIGAWRISRKRVLTRHMPAIETLGAATVFCVDKTGTLTMNRMSVTRLFAQGKLYRANPEADEPLPGTFRELVRCGFLASPEETFDPMDRAFLEFAKRYFPEEPPGKGYRIVREYPFSRDILAMGRVWKREEGDSLIVAAKGAPEAIAELCQLNSEERARLAEVVGQLASEGLRVLGVARSTWTGGEPLESLRGYPFEFLGLAGLSDPVRRGVPEAVAQCHDAGIRIIMITGDYPVTAATIARQIGLEHPDNIITGDELRAMSGAELGERIRSAQIFARILPEQKLRIVEALKDSGEIVAMTGDGVNDAPALKAAHIGIAMGARGCDVAREAASLILLDDEFPSIVEAIRLGRRIYDNMRKAVSYIFAIHVPIAGISLLPVMFRWPLILMPVHIVFLELIIDPACSTAFEAEPAEENVMRRPPRDPGESLFHWRLIRYGLLQGLGALLVSLAVFGVALVRGQGEMDARALGFTTLVITNLLLIWGNRSSKALHWSALAAPNRALWWVTSGALVFLAIVLRVPSLRGLFQFSFLHPADIAICLAAGFVFVLWLEGLKCLARRSA
ncbi:MAG: cation-translocating P-type ATPase [Acidobacteriia bacterium]|nr:cation-translocating P-type ATPase [Terriglobia bacterium]